ncbi:MAG: laccase domain-containing protein, partial [Proteobacteria bacterium]|nr:laccase domain-containing protein [Pseudomonadota bacterium]
MELIVPDWPAPGNVRACATTRIGGVSREEFSSLNLAGHVGDRDDQVAENRKRLCAFAGLPAEP